MSKISTLLVAGGGGTVVAVSGAYLIKNGLGQGETPEVSLLFESVEKFEQGWKTKSTCVTDLFKGEFDDSGTPLTTFTTSDGTFFSNTIDGQDPYKSCVIIDWKKENYTGDKGTGKFTGTGTFVKGNEGFVNFNVAETISGEQDKLKFTGVFYLLGKEGSGTPKGKVKHKKEVKGDTKKIGQDNLDTYFPKKKTDLTVADVANDYGDFFKNVNNGQPQLQDICGASECQDASKMTPTSKRIELTGTGIPSPTGQDTKTLKGWSNDLNWGNNIYDLSPSGSLDSKISTFKGNGTKKT